MINIKNNQPKLEIDELDYLVAKNPNIEFETFFSEEKIIGFMLEMKIKI